MASKMDMRIWKRTVQQWIAACGFKEPNSPNIEQNDIEEFFQNFRKHHEVAARSLNCQHFLREHYPDLEPHLDDENALSAQDYIYIYSVLMHFSCVKYPVSFFHESCQRLSEQSQQVMAGFFSRMLECAPITKENLRHKIAELGSPSATAARLSDSFSPPSANGSGGGTPSPKFGGGVVESLLRTPRRKMGGTAQHLSPATPRTYMLEEKTRELYSLRAMLETERYEKGLLEVQIRQNEEKIKQLNHDHKKLKLQIQDLKNDVLMQQTDEGTSPRRDGEENQMKRRFCKEISQKVQEIEKLNDALCALREENTRAREERKVADKKVKTYTNHIKELEYKVDSQSAELEQKDKTIKYLNEAKADYEHVLNEYRMKEHRDMNSTFECLDASIARCSNASGSDVKSSPETLATSVIDKQLREREKENVALREEMAAMRDNQTYLAQQMREVVVQHTQSFDISQAYSNDADDPLECFAAVADCLNTLSKNYKNEENNVKKVTDEIKLLSDENAELKAKVARLDNELTKVQRGLDAAETLSNNLQHTRNKLESIIKDCEHKLQIEREQKKTIANNMEQLVNEFSEYRTKNNTKLQEFEQNVEELLKEREGQNRENSHYGLENERLKKEMEKLQTKMQEVHDEYLSKTTDYEMKMEKLNGRLLSQLKELETRGKAESMVKERHEALLVQYESLKDHTRKTDKHLETMRADLVVKDNEMAALGKEFGSLRQLNSDLVGRINDLMNEMRKEREKYDQAMNKKDEQIANLTAEGKTLGQQLKDTQDELLQSSENVKNILTEVQALHALLKQPMVESSLPLNLSMIREYLQNLLKSQEDLKLEYASCIGKMENLLKANSDEKTEILKNHEKELSMLRMELKLGEDKILESDEYVQKLIKDHANKVQRMENDFRAREEDTRRTQAMNKDSDTLVQRLHAELKNEKHESACKERELVVLIGEHNDLKRLLNDTIEKLENALKENETVRKEYEKRIKDITKRIDELLAENSELKCGICAFKVSHTQFEDKLHKVDGALANLSAKLSVHTLDKSELSAKLASSQNRLQETEFRLTNILQEKTVALSDLQIAYDTQLGRMRLQDDELGGLIKLRAEQEEQIASLKAKLRRNMDEKELLMREASTYTAQIEREQKEKSSLLNSLSGTAEQLKTAVEEKDTHVQDLSTQCAELQTRFQEATDNCRQLEKKLKAKENEMLRNSEMLTDAIQKSAIKSEILESYDLSVVDIMATLEKNAFIFEDVTHGVENMFNVNEGEHSAFNYLRIILNKIYHNFNCVEEQRKISEEKRQDLNEVVDRLTRTNAKLNSQIVKQKAQMGKMQDMLTDEAKTVETKLTGEVRRLNEVLQNVESVNEKLTNENAALHTKVNGREDEVANLTSLVNLRNEEKRKLYEEQRATNDIVEQQRQDIQRVHDELNTKQKTIADLHSTLQEQTDRAAELEAELATRSTECESQVGLLQEMEAELKLRSEQFRRHLATQNAMQADLDRKCRELNELQQQIMELSDVRRKLEDKFLATSNRLDEAMSTTKVQSTQFEELESRYASLQREHETCEDKHKQNARELIALKNDVETSAAQRQILEDELQECRREKAQATKDVSQLILQITAVQKEKDVVDKEYAALREKLASIDAQNDEQVRTMSAGMQGVERKLAAAEKEIATLRAQAEVNGERCQQMNTDHQRLQDTNEAMTKRVEGMAVKLGDMQARCANLERENERGSKALAAMQHLQRERDTLAADNKALKERLNRFERAQEQLNLHETELKVKLVKAEKQRDCSDEKIRKMEYTLTRSEDENTRLKLEVGALNSQLVEANRTSSAENIRRLADVERQLSEAQIQTEKHKMLCEELQSENEGLQQQNSRILEQLSQVSASLKMSDEKCVGLVKDLDRLRQEMLAMREEKAAVEREASETLKKLQELETANVARQDGHVQMIAALEAKVSSKSEELEQLLNEVEALRTTAIEKFSQDERSGVEIECLRAKMETIEALLDKERETGCQLRMDNQILQAKYREAKQKALDDAKLSEEKIKENRLELEGKLEKMKNKMKTLYTEEITKLKTKQEREIKKLNVEVDILRTQNTKFEDHNRKMSAQVMRLNERILELQKQNTMISTRLQHLSGSGTEFKRPASVASTTMSGATGTNLAMEDEEGEVFNNTYLTDLKSGRMPEHMTRDVCAQELQYRNSLLPPHLKSTYAAQYDHGLLDDDLKDMAPCLDDSLSALLSTTAGGTRKKMSGTTLYKRPGPPTPSKNGGRLSFGGSSEPAREILKESDNGNAPNSNASGSKTPARFSFFSSRFSLGNTKDEDLRVTLHRRQIDLLRNVCTSTPRKIGTYFDESLHLEELLRCSLLPSGTSLRELPDVSAIETPVTRQTPRSTAKLRRCNRRKSLASSQSPPRKSAKKPLKKTSAGTEKGAGLGQQRLRTPTSTDTAASSPTGVRLPRRQRTRSRARPSLNLQGNVYGRYRSPNRAAQQNRQRNLARENRMETFNQRRWIGDAGVDAGAIVQRDSFYAFNNNYTQVNRNHSPSCHQTVVIVKDVDRTYDLRRSSSVCSFAFEGALARNQSSTSEDEDVENAAPNARNEAWTGREEEVRVTKEDLQELEPQLVATHHHHLHLELSEGPVTKKTEAAAPEIKVTPVADAVPALLGVENPATLDAEAQFEAKLTDTASEAPFDVNPRPFDEMRPPPSQPSRLDSTGGASGASGAAASSSCSQALAHTLSSQWLSTATAGGGTPSQVSRTIYGGSVILNRRIPNVNSTHVRKSSIYVKNRNSSGHDVILYTDQSITLADILPLWRQMNPKTRFIVLFTFVAPCLALLAYVLW